MAGPSSSFKRSRRSPPLSSKFASDLKSSKGTKQIKMVKFADFDDAPDIPSSRAKRTIPNHGTGGAKTSEFMYFKKLSGTAGQKAISKPQSVEAQESNKVRVSVLNQGEKEPPGGFSRSISPRREQLNGEPSCSDAECENGSMFSNKRRNLIKLAAKTLSVGVDDFFLRRSDLIGELIQRLGNKQQPKTKKGISSSCLETPMEKYTHIGHRIKMENLYNLASNLPTLPYIDLEPNMRPGWSIQKLESSEPYPDFSTCFHDKRPCDSASYLLPFSPCRDLIPYSFGTEVQDESPVPHTCFQRPADNFQSFHDRKPHDSANYLLPFSPCRDLIPYSFGNGVQDQSLFPYVRFQSPVNHFQSPADEFNSELTCWDVKEKEEKHPHLPLALYNPASFYDEAEELVGDEFLGSPPRKTVSALEPNSSYVCERNNFFSDTVDEDFSVANEQSLLLVKENPVNRNLEFGCDLPLLDPQYFLSGSIWCEYLKDSSDPFLIDS